MEILHDIQLQPYNSFRTRALAKFFCEPESAEQIKEVLSRFPDEEKLALGGGCNLFFTKNFDGLVIRPAVKGISLLDETADELTVEAGAAEDWDGFVDYCVRRGLSGLENLSLIPGTVGAAPVQNIGAYGAEVKDVITVVKSIDIKSGATVDFDNGACRFAYRDSIFKQMRRYVVTSVIFRLKKSFVYRKKYVDLNEELNGIDSPSLAQVREAVIRVRERKLPDYRKLPNAGSFFKNPILTFEEKENLLSLCPEAPVFPLDGGVFKTSAAYLIDKAGLKGKREGKVGIYEKHALIIVNYGTDDGKKILSFMQSVQQTVSDRYGIKLEPEVWVF
ncbi:MAG: UDP-N-acetylmuramate dehydrogenase [Dysgonamonadaceae bacterium]|jgi:UDP-N-acetylmuramate dehydrogenase|nr:UDP-N-acetylmuramate dehydrogenase [Dysgonamonadaceae bacterium]